MRCREIPRLARAREKLLSRPRGSATLRRVRLLSAVAVAGSLVGCAAASTGAPTPAAEPAQRPGVSPAVIAASVSPTAAAAPTPAVVPPRTAATIDATANDTGSAASFADAEPRLRAAGFPTLADILSVRVTQTRRKMKLTDEEAARAALALIDELPAMPHARKLLELMPKATVELVRSVRERNVARDEAERMAEYLLEVRASLAMDNPAPFDENCSHVVGREWQDIDYRDEGMTWQKQQAIYAPKGVADFKSVTNLRQFFRIESKAPYFQKLYQVKGSAP